MIPKYILVHCSDVSERTIYDQFKSINNYHRDDRQFPVSTKGFYVGYHYLVTGEKVYKCREDWEVGSHCNDKVDGVSMNFQSIGVAWGGDGDTELPSKVHKDLLKGTITRLMEEHNIPLERVKFHCDFDTKGKTCPGSLFTKEYLKGIIQPVEIPIVVEKCNDEKKIIESQKKQIFNLQTFISNLIRFFRT